MTNEEKINLIGQKILLLSNNLDKYKTELQQLQQQLEQLKTQQKQTATPPKIENIIPIVQEQVVPETKIIEDKPQVQETIVEKVPDPVVEFMFTNKNTQQPVKPVSNFNFEEFIGGKLLTIVGIVILVIGLGIGVKYAIDNDMLGPIARIALAYVAGGILLALALKLKEKYKAFSAVLLSGGMASLYFTTFVAYSLYHMFPQIAAFAIMVVFTAFTVFAATVYELEVIGIIGLVGAYAVPMLLSDGSGKIGIMFSYMTIINSGILILSFKKLWRGLNYFAFGFTWLIVTTWFMNKYNYELHFGLTVGFSFVFFIIFYISNFSYKIVKHEALNAGDVITLVLNSFIFFGLGYGALNNVRYHDYAGLFTLINALVHLVFAYIVVYQNKRAENKLIDRNLFYLLMALVLSFFTIAVPVQLNGNWVTLLWAAEALLMFGIGRYKNIRFYEWLGYVMALLSVISLIEDWNKNYYYLYTIPANRVPFFNIHLFTSLFVIAVLGAIHYINHKKELVLSDEKKKSDFHAIMEYVIPGTFFIIGYLAFNNEIKTFFEIKFKQSVINIPVETAWAEPGAMQELYDYSWLKLKDVVQHIYNLLFFSVITVLVIRKWSNPALRWALLSLNLLVVLGFIFSGLYQLRDLRNYYLDAHNTQYYSYSSLMIYIRYICFGLLAVLLYLVHLFLKQEPFSKTLSRLYSGGIIHLLILIVLSVELVHLNIIQNYQEPVSYYRGTNAVYRIGLTSLWGIYAFVFIAYGIVKEKQATRIAAISIVAIAILKLLIVDTWDMSTGYKVVSYMLLGVILLIVAFLYQKFKKVLFNDDEKNESPV